MSTEHIQQANEGCDMDFLQTQFGASAGEPTFFDMRAARGLKTQAIALFDIVLWDLMWAATRAVAETPVRL